jgi:hypothetical protein
MGIHTTIEPLTEADVSALTKADEPLAKLLAEFSAQRAAEAGADNRAALGFATSAKAAVNGTTVPGAWSPAALLTAIRRAQTGAIRTQLNVVVDFVLEVGAPALEDVVFKLWRASGSRWGPVLAQALAQEARLRIIKNRGPSGPLLGRDAANALQGWADSFADAIAPLIDRIGSAFGAEAGRSVGRTVAKFLVVAIARQLGGSAAAAAVEVALAANMQALVNALLRQAATHFLFNILRGSDTDESDRNEILVFIATQLRLRSPVLTGRYRDAHMLYADDVAVASAADVANGDADIPEAKVYEFRNAQPYARKIEVGKTEAGRDFVLYVEPRIYERVMRDAKRKYGDLADFTYALAPQGDAAAVSISVRMKA